MNRCRQCVMPDTRPDVPFTNGVCQACINYARRPQIDWEARRKALVDLLDRHHGECIVPSSGGKDSTAQVIKLLDMGAHVTAVTATTCHLTPIGRANIDNLARYCKTIETTPNRTVRAKLNRLGLQLVGDISWPEHVSIFTTPFNVSAEIGIPLLIYGENPQDQYGGPLGTEEATQMTRRWVSEFGGFLGLRPQDLIGMDGITERDMYEYVPREQAYSPPPEAHFLGQYLPWDSHENAQIAHAAGMRQQFPTPNSWWPHENLDNAQTGLHDHMMYLKYGYGRACAQISVDIRAGKIDPITAFQWLQDNDGKFPVVYADVPVEAMLNRIGIKMPDLHRIMDQFTNKALFRRVEDNAEAPQVLIG